MWVQPIFETNIQNMLFLGIAAENFDWQKMSLRR